MSWHVRVFADARWQAAAQRRCERQPRHKFRKVWVGFGGCGVGVFGIDPDFAVQLREGKGGGCGTRAACRRMLKAEK